MLKKDVYQDLSAIIYANGRRFDTASGDETRKMEAANREKIASNPGHEDEVRQRLEQLDFEMIQDEIMRFLAFLAPILISEGASRELAESIVLAKVIETAKELQAAVPLNPKNNNHFDKFDR
jgi:hypothetical protein